MYSLSEQLRIGEIGGYLLDGYFCKLYNLQFASSQDEYNGIDRIAFRPDGKQILLEYKTDLLAERTGNAFIETCAYDASARGQRSGWAYTSQANVIVYFLPLTNRLYLIRPHRLRSRMPQWERKYRQVQVINAGWTTHGLLVPLQVLLTERIAILVNFKESDHAYCQHVTRTARDNLLQPAEICREYSGSGYGQLRNSSDRAGSIPKNRRTSAVSQNRA